MREIDKAYLAGFLDGEGSIGIYPYTGGSGLSLKVVITNTYKSVLQELQELWGGYFHTNNPQKDGWKAGSALEWSCKAAAKLLEEIQPYLHVKKEQCQVALKFQNTINPKTHRTKPVPPEVQIYRLELKNQMRELNRKGTRCNP